MSGLAIAGWIALGLVVGVACVIAYMTCTWDSGR
jgi:hypothetical protein